MHTSDPADREAMEILNLVDAIRRMLSDLSVERKRLVWEQVDRWIAMEEAGAAKQAGQQH